MKSLLTLMTLTFAIAAGSAADSASQEAVKKAAKALSEKPNYSWHTTVVVPEGTQFRQGPSDGKTEKDGFTWISRSFGQGTTQAVSKGEKAALTNQDGEWQSAAEAENEEGFGRFRAAMARNIAKPAAQAEELAGQVKELKMDGDAYVGELTEEGAKGLMRFGGRRGGGQGGPNILFAKGSVKFWVKDGQLVKYETKVDGSMEFNGNEREVKNTTTVEIKDVGKTKIELPAAALKKLE